jgi:predicted nucleotidyltransferase
MLSDKEKKIILNTLNPHQIKSVGVFGSFARNEERETSDIDLLVEFEESPNLLDLIGLEQELSDLLNRKVELITKRSLSPLISNFVEKDLIPLF